MFVTRSIARMLEPSASMDTARTFFSFVSAFISFSFVWTYRVTKYMVRQQLFVTQKQKPKMGRPKLPKGAARSEIIKTRVSPAERKVLEAAAESSGKEVSEWIRSVLLAEAA
jgi:hypothetical protein